MENEQNSLVKIVETSGLEKTKADLILEKFTGYFKMAAEWELKARAIVVTSADQIAEMKMAREGRLFMKQKRLDIESTRKELKEQALREGKAVDGIANVLKALIAPIEEHFERQENFVEIQEEEAKEKRKTERTTEIQSIGLDPALYDLKNMPEESYSKLVVGHKLAVQAQIAAEKQAEQERKEREIAQEQTRLENERLKKDAEEREKQIVEERAKAEAEKRAIEEKNRKEKELAESKSKKEREEAEKKLVVERQAKAKLEAELRAKAEAEEAEKKRIDKEKKDALKAPDKTKLFALAEALLVYPFPETKSQEAKKIVAGAKDLLAKTAKYINDNTKQL